MYHNWAASWRLKEAIQTFFLLGNALLMEEGLAPVDERLGIGFPAEFREIHLLESGRPVVVVFIGGRGPGARYRVGRMLLLLECIDRGLQVLHCRHEGVGQGGEVRYGRP